jgi:hypothetical protein
MARRIEQTTTFLNIDLEVWSRQPLGPLVTAFGEINLYDGPIGRRYLASFETAAMVKGADATIRALVRRVRGLRDAARKLWDGAARRDFNIGIQGGAEPFSLELGLEPATIRAIEEVHGGLVITVYGAESQAPAAKKKPTKVSARRAP